MSQFAAVDPRDPASFFGLLQAAVGLAAQGAYRRALLIATERPAWAGGGTARDAFKKAFAFRGKESLWQFCHDRRDRDDDRGAARTHVPGVTDLRLVKQVSDVQGGPVAVEVLLEFLGRKLIVSAKGGLADTIWMLLVAGEDDEVAITGEVPVEAELALGEVPF